MPTYVYRCTLCEETFEIRHGMSEDQDSCIKCKAKQPPSRVPSSIAAPPKGTDAKPPGTLVNKFIRDAKKEVNLEKDRLKKQEKN